MRRSFYLIGLLFLSIPAFLISQSQADGPDPACKNLSSITSETAKKLFGTFKKTNDSQIAVDLCGNALATMYSQLKIPQIPINTLAGEYAIPAKSSNTSSSTVPALHSNPLATRKLFLDFDGYTFPTNWRDSAWLMGGGSFGGRAQPGASLLGLDLDGNPSNFSSLESAYITETWQAVAEAFSTLDIDVTTEDPGLAGLSRSSLSDVNFGMTAVVSSDASWSSACNCGGVAYQPSFNQLASSPNGFNIYAPAFNFNKFDPNSNSYISAKDLGGVINHELGHTLGLTHDGTTVAGASGEYYPGHGNWAPIMGSSWDKAVRQWSKNEYSNGSARSPGNGCGAPTGGWWPQPNNKDDFDIFTCNDVSLKRDDYGDDLSDATLIDASAGQIVLPGIVGPNDDIDFFKFVLSSANQISISALPIANSPMLDILLKVYDSNGSLIVSVNPEMRRGTDGKPLGMSASISRRSFTAGTYYVSIQGTGSGNPLDTGYSSYSSVGQYSFNFEVNYQPQATLSISNTALTNAVGTTVTITTSGGSGTGSITYAVSGANCSLTSNALTASGPASCVVTAVKAQDSTFAASNTATKTFIFLADQDDLTITNSVLTNSTGTIVNLTSTGGSGSGAVTYRLSTPNALCSLDGATITANQPAQCSVVATKASQGLYASKTSEAVTFTFKGPQATLSISNTSRTNAVGTSVTLTTTGGSGSGAVSYTVTGANCTLTDATLGASSAATCSVIATKASDTSYAQAVSSAVSFIFLGAQDALTISNQNTTNAVRVWVPLTTTGGSGSGAVTYALSTPNTQCVIQDSRVTARTATTCSVVATKAASGAYASVRSDAVVFTFMGPQAILSISNTALTNAVGTTVTITTSGGSGTGSITYAVSGANCSLTSNALTASGPASCVVTAVKAQDSTFAASNTATKTFIFLADQDDLTITNSVLTNSTGTIVNLTSTGGSGSGAVTYRLSTPNALCSLDGATITANQPAQCSVVATKASQGLYASKTSEAVTFTFKGPQATLSISNTSRTNAVGTSVTLTTTGGSGSGAVSYTVTGANCTLTDATLGASSAATCSVIATKASDTSYAQAVSSAVSFIFLGAQDALTISNQNTTNAVRVWVPLTTTGGSGSGAVTYALSTPNTQCVIQDSRVTARTATTCSVVATKAASGAYASVRSDAVVFTFMGPQAILSISNTALTNAVGTTVTITTSGGSGTGSITYAVSGANCSLTSNALTASGPASCVVTAVKAQDSTFAASNTATKTFIFLADQDDLTITNSVLTNSTGTIVNLTSTGGSGSGAVTYRLSTPNALCSLDGATITANQPAQCSVVATKASQGLYASKTSEAVTFTFKGPQATLSISNTSRTNAVGTSVTLTTTGGSGSGAVSYTVTGANCTLTDATLGASSAATCSVIATKASDTSYAQAVSSAVSFIFLGAQDALTISNQNTTNAVRVWVPLTTTGGSGSGAVTYALSTPNTQCVIQDSRVTARTATTCSVVATKAASGAYASVRSDAVVFTFMGPQAILSISNTALTNAVGTTVTITTSGGSGTGSITYAVSGANCSLTSNALTASGPASCVVTAVKAQDSTFAASNTATKTFIFLADQDDLTITNSVLTNSTGTIVNLTSTGGSGSGAVTYRLSTPNALCSLDGATITANQPAQCSVVATKASQGLYASKTSEAVTFTFKGPQATLSISNTSRTNAVGTSVTLTTTGGSGSGAVSYTVTGANCTLTDATLGASSAATCSVIATKASDTSYAQAVSSAVSFIFLGAQDALTISNQNTTNAVRVWVPLTTTGGSGSGAVTYALSTPNTQCVIQDSRVTARTATTCSVVATKAASGAYASVRSDAVVFTFMGPQAILSISNTALTNAVGTTVTITTSGGSGTGSITYAVSGANCSLTSNALTASGPASCVVTAVKAQDSTFAASNTATKTFIFLADQDDLTITNSVLTNSTGTIVNLTSTGGSGSGAVTYRLSTPNALCSLDGATITANQPAQCSVVATKASQGLYASKTSEAVTFTFKGPQATLSISNTSRTNAVGTSVTLTTTGGSGSGAVSYTVTGANCTLTDATLGASSAATCSVIATKASDTSYAGRRYLNPRTQQGPGAINFLIQHLGIDIHGDPGIRVPQQPLRCSHMDSLLFEQVGIGMSQRVNTHPIRIQNIAQRFRRSRKLLELSQLGYDSDT
jgi:hypothetical protein